VFDLIADQPVAKKIRSRSAGNRGAVDTATVDAGSFGHNVLHRERRIFSGRRSHCGTHTATRCHGTRSLPTSWSVEGRDRG